MKKIPTSSIDLIITDPPYNLGKFMEERDTNLVKMRDNFFGAAGWDDLDYKEWKKSMNKFFHQASRVLKDGGSIIVFMAIIKVETIIQLAQILILLITVTPAQIKHFSPIRAVPAI